LSVLGANLSRERVREEKPSGAGGRGGREESVLVFESNRDRCSRRWDYIPSKKPKAAKLRQTGHSGWVETGGKAARRCRGRKGAVGGGPVRVFGSRFDSAVKETRPYQAHPRGSHRGPAGSSRVGTRARISKGWKVKSPIGAVGLVLNTVLGERGRGALPAVVSRRPGNSAGRPEPRSDAAGGPPGLFFRPTGETGFGNNGGGIGGGWGGGTTGRDKRGRKMGQKGRTGKKEEAQ